MARQHKNKWTEAIYRMYVHVLTGMDEDISDTEMQDIENVDDIIIGNRRPRNQTNWCYRHDALSQTQYAYQIQMVNDLLFHTDQVKKLICFCTFLLTLLTLMRRNGNTTIIPNRFQRAIFMVSTVIIYHKSKACHIERELDNLLNIFASDRVATPFQEKKNRSIEVLSAENAYSWTCYTKPQLQQLMLHLQILPIVNPNVYGGRREYTGEEVLIISLTKIALGMSWLHLTEFFGGDPREFSGIFWWFIDYLFVTFCNKISGRSLESWVNYITECRSVICERISQSPSPIEIQIDPTLENHEVLAWESALFRMKSALIIRMSRNHVTP
jgi:hypothetical protein